jgi:hypothetical protein
MARPPRPARQRRGARPGPGQQELGLEYAPGQSSRNIAGTTSPEDQRPSPEEQQQQASLQRPFSPISSDPDWQPYSPTKTKAPYTYVSGGRQRIETRRRTEFARYNAEQGWLDIMFRTGETYRYYGVDNAIWLEFVSDRSPGMAINRMLNGLRYQRGKGFDDSEHEYAERAEDLRGYWSQQ